MGWEWDGGADLITRDRVCSEEDKIKLIQYTHFIVFSLGRELELLQSSLKESFL